ncbi:MAG: helix-turn-helix transcriptional regulator [Deltaproteobacteria bacterium]
MQINRLFEIVYILLDKKRVTAKEFAEYFGVSVRTIHRDIDTLSAAGIPIYTSKGRGGGIRLLDDYVLNKSVLSEQEQNGILMSLQSLSAVKYPDLEPVFNKLSILFNKTQSNWIEVDFSHWGSEGSERAKFDILRNAIINNRVISFDYFSSYGERTSRMVEPLKLVFKGQAWYIYSFCRVKHDFRLFKIKRIRNLAVNDETFFKVVPDDIWAGNDDSCLDRMVRLVLKVDEDMAYRVYDEFYEEQIFQNSDGTFNVTITLPEDNWMYGYILSFGGSLEVLEPIHIRKAVASRLQEHLKKYT